MLKFVFYTWSNGGNNFLKILLVFISIDRFWSKMTYDSAMVLGRKVQLASAAERNVKHGQIYAYLATSKHEISMELKKIAELCGELFM